MTRHGYAIITDEGILIYMDECMKASLDTAITAVECKTGVKFQACRMRLISYELL